MMQHFKGAPGGEHHKTPESIMKNMFVYGATAIFCLGVVAIIGVGVYKILEWMISL